MLLPDACRFSTLVESKRQIFLDPSGWRAWITNALLIVFGAVFLAAVIVIAMGVVWAPRVSAPASRGAKSPAHPVAANGFAPSPREPQISFGQNRAAPAYASKQMRLGFLSNDEGDLLSLAEHARDLDGIVPQWLELANGPRGPALRIHRDQSSTIDWIRENAKELSIYPELDNHLSDGEMSKLLADKSGRNALVDQIVAYLGTRGLAGVALNLTRIPPSACLRMAAFLHELRSKLHEDARKAFAIVSPDEQLGCLGGISDAVDFVISATHDENAERSRSGAPASQGWFEAHLRMLVAAVPASKLIVAIGAFASDVSWTGRSKIIPVQRAWDILHRETARLEFDQDSLIPNFGYDGDDGGRHRVWLLDGVTAFNQARAAMAMPIAGVAIWRLGLEDPGVWHSIALRRSPDELALRALESIPPGYGNYRFVQGALLSAGPDAVGRRRIVYDRAVGLVVGAEVVEPPLRGELGVWRPSDPTAVALTFDDGPDRRFTGRILDILRDKGVHATFYLIGRHILSSPDLVRRMYAEGHDIGNHTFSHPDSFKIGAERLEIELNATERILEAAVGIQSNLFRPPYGGMHFGYLDADPHVIQAATRLGYLIGGMDVDSCDYCAMQTQWIVRSVMDGVVRRQGRIVLMHDSGGDREATIAALPTLIDELQAAGFHFVTTHELVGLPREEIMRPWRPLALIADMQMETWRKLIDGVRWVGERGPTIMIATAVLGIGRLLIIVILAIIQFWRRTRLGRSPEPYRGPVDVLVPAFNEEKVICKTVEAILSSSTPHPELRVIVIDDGSKDRTSEVLRQRFPDEPRLKILRKENGGKAAALNYGIARSTADVVVAIDGDTMLCSDAIERLTARFSDPAVGAVAGNVVVGNAINLMTRFQAIEYVMSQNLDRRAFELFNAIGVVPGAIGAWRRRAVLQAGGYAPDTMAEDADLTFAVQMRGWRVLAEPSAVALTEAPETLRAFMKQRFRWMFGTLQVACKHAGALARRPTGLAFIAIPNVFLFQMLFTLMAPFVDAFLLWTVLGGFYLGQPEQLDTIIIISEYWLVFQTTDCVAAAVAICLSGERTYWRLLPLLLLQRFTYRQLLYVTAIRSLLAAIKGTLVGWGKLVRTGNVFGAKGVSAIMR